MQIINLTPHAIHLVDETGEIARVFEPSGSVARVVLEERYAGTIEGLPVVTVVQRGIDGLPEQRDGVLYLVSSPVRSYCGLRNDLLTPGGLVRDSSGRVIGCRYLVRNPDRDRVVDTTAAV